eukprot:gene15705-17949_t
MLQFSTIRLTEEDPKLSADSVNKQILTGNCEDIGIVLTLSQALQYNIRLDADNILGLTKIDMRRAADVIPDVKSPSLTTASYEAQEKYDQNSYLMHGGNNLPEAPLTMERRRQILERGKREMDAVNDSLLEMLEELDF